MFYTEDHMLTLSQRECQSLFPYIKPILTKYYTTFDFVQTEALEVEEEEEEEEEEEKEPMEEEKEEEKSGSEEEKRKVKKRKKERTQTETRERKKDGHGHRHQHGRGIRKGRKERRRTVFKPLAATVTRGSSIGLT